MAKTKTKTKQSATTKHSYSLLWAFEPFAQDPSFITKHMFGGLAGYLHDKIVLVLMESPGDRQWRGKTFDFDIWDGLLYPTEKTFHDDLRQRFPSLVPHPVLPKWLYLPTSAEDFEETALDLARLIHRQDRRLGVLPKKRAPKAAKSATSRGKFSSSRRPRTP